VTEHDRRTAGMLAQTTAIAGGLFAAGVAGVLLDLPNALRLVPALGLGLWFQRLYVVGHEAAHKNLDRARPRFNDAVGQLALLPILVPLSVFRAIHHFHHGENRRDPHGSALDVYTVPAGAGPLRRAAPWALWYLAVFAGGWFVHGLVSVVMFLALPPRIARRVSPAFRRWTVGDQLRASAVFAVGVGLHLAVVAWLGAAGWAWALGLPFATFAWVYSAQLYIYHYGTTMGPEVRFHARPLRASRLTSWWLLHLDEHDTHHREPRVPWYRLRERRQPPPTGFAANHTGHTWLGGVLHQLRGPTVQERA
jgi:fatty acid desaturase